MLEGEELTGVTPTALAVKMVKRGVVPLLIDIAKADVGYPSIVSMDALAAISRVKDCRTIIFQHSGGLDLIRKALSSSEGSLVSPTMLLILHLMWDEEWWHTLSTVEPQIELQCARWGVFAMDRIVKRAETAKNEREEKRDAMLDMQIRAFRMENGLEKDQLLQSAKEEKEKLGGDEWFGLESEENRSPIDSFLGRCLLVLSTFVKMNDGPDRLLQVNALSFFSSCLDCPIVDIQAACIGGLHNLIIGSNVRAVPSGVFDPDQFVRSIVVGTDRFMKAGEHSQRATLFFVLANYLKADPAWEANFERLPPFYKMVADEFLGRIKSLKEATRAIPRKRLARGITLSMSMRNA